MAARKSTNSSKDPFHSFKYFVYDIAALITVLVVVGGIVEKELSETSLTIRVSVLIVLILFGLWAAVMKLTHNDDGP